MSLAVQAKAIPKIITIAGESGSGKTTIGHAAAGLLPADVRAGAVQGQEPGRADAAAEMFDFRKDVQAVFQDPFAVYNPFYKVDNLLSIPIKNFKLASSQDRGADD